MTTFISKRQTRHACELLGGIRVAQAVGKRKRAEFLSRQYLNSFDAKSKAVDQSYKHLKPHRRPHQLELEDIARRLDAWKGTDEEVFVHLNPKASNPDTFRVIMDFGIENR